MKPHYVKEGLTMKTSVMIVDDNAEFTNELTQYLEKTETVSVLV